MKLNNWSNLNNFTYDVDDTGNTNSWVEITKSDYNYLDLPVKLVKGTENVLYSYDAIGRKLIKTLESAVMQTLTVSSTRMEY
ncbi:MULTISPECIES: hypothetical protein [Sphingobacterium]|uniref:Uncharacterized protein n=1 Tax=Sphingobacterium athyrii TaxID=2152717 RepID=A0A363NKC4_9SPHI|nr:MULTISPECIES: hypothetical protein [Sphingobacterium]PUV21081.1 hypothetical protein DCO56_28885 [Sphingobacterium athyrii]QIH34412.1 hypothetical protein G6053_16635 [Sphingobacterium sp. DR205]